MEKTIFDVLEEIKVDASRAAFDNASRIVEGGDIYLNDLYARQRDVFLQRKKVIAAIMRELSAEVLERIAE